MTSLTETRMRFAVASNGDYDEAIRCSIDRSDFGVRRSRVCQIDLSAIAGL